MEHQKKGRKRKRPDGDGSIRYSEAKKLWIGRVMVGYRPDGKPDVREVAAKQQGECRKKLDAIKARMSDGTLGDVKAGRETVALTPEGAAAMIETPVLSRAGTQVVVALRDDVEHRRRIRRRRIRRRRRDGNRHALRERDDTSLTDRIGSRAQRRSEQQGRGERPRQSTNRSCQRTRLMPISFGRPATQPVSATTTITVARSEKASNAAE